MRSFAEWVHLREVNEKLVQYMQGLVPNWPPYVVSDLLYKGHSPSLKRPSADPRELPEYLRNFASFYGFSDPGEIKWSLEDLNVKRDIFDEDTLRRMKERGMGELNPYGVPDDAQRHAGAQDRMRKNPNIRVGGYAGPASVEPIIVARWRNNTYELIEGWHRTIQSILARPEGYRQKAYVLDARK